MKPRDLLKKYLLSDVVPAVESLGFKYSASQLHFARKNQNTRQVFSFSLSKWNSENRCTFWTMWRVTSTSYANWHKEQWGEFPVNNALGGDLDCNISNWERGKDHYFHLYNNEADKNEIERLIKNILQVGVPFLESVSTWEGAAEHFLAHKFMYHRVADFFIIAGKPERAKDVLLEGIKQYEDLGRIDNFGDLPMIKARLAKYR
jgi:Domain of unknown function (DUF4304)